MFPNRSWKGNSSFPFNPILKFPFEPSLKNKVLRINHIPPLHLWTFKTPILSAVMNDKGGADWAFQMPNGVMD
jgi:hypothetical protein